MVKKLPVMQETQGTGNGYPLQYSCLENPMDRGAWRATVGGVTEPDITEVLIHTHTELLGMCAKHREQQVLNK